ncbi:SRPBCC family protein [Nocardioides bruguierae]|uniref:SRPBCC family protein n=1 Tax=Nocardioides bruguierae TaxID=2945102 RepID=UPI00202227EC|nr:SRPBCC family protein [Nocardioides bruguierae]MCL8024033.1 SRPBCC family protein [Nocardioides bruguierae]
MTVQSSIVVDTAPSVVFSIVADPRQHARIDGSGTVVAGADTSEAPQRLALGDTFGMRMRLGVPYATRNTVVEHTEDRLIAWRHVGKHRWRYEIEPLDLADGVSRCRVTETWDDSGYGPVGRRVLALLGYPARNQRAIEATLLRLKDAAERDAGLGEEDA